MSLDQREYSVLWASPVTTARELVWTMDRASHDSVASVHGFTFRLVGDANPVALATALADVVERHDALRLTTVMVNRKRRQRVEPVGAPLDLIDLRGVDSGQRLERARAVMATVLERPFNLARPPFLRAVLLRLAERDRMLGLGMHHVLCDGTSTGRLLDDLFEAYRAATAASQVQLRFPDYEHRVPCDRHRVVAGPVNGVNGAATIPTSRVGRMDQRGEAPRPAGTTPGSGQDGGPQGSPSCSRNSRFTAAVS
jgi:Condensation domain